MNRVRRSCGETVFINAPVHEFYLDEIVKIEDGRCPSNNMHAVRTKAMQEYCNNGSSTYVYVLEETEDRGMYKIADIMDVVFEREKLLKY